MNRCLTMVVCAWALVLLPGCGEEDPCALVSCSPGRVCVPETGVCQAVDAGTP